MFLDTRLKFSEHVKSIIQKTNITIGLLKIHYVLPTPPLFTIYKSFVRPHLAYVDIIYQQAYNNSFQKKIDSIQYIAALAIIGAIRGSLTERMYQELSLESLQQGR